MRTCHGVRGFCGSSSGNSNGVGLMPVYKIYSYNLHLKTWKSTSLYSYKNMENIQQTMATEEPFKNPELTPGDYYYNNFPKEYILLMKVSLNRDRNLSPCVISNSECAVVCRRLSVDTFNVILSQFHTVNLQKVQRWEEARRLPWFFLVLVLVFSPCLSSSSPSCCFFWWRWVTRKVRISKLLSVSSELKYSVVTDWKKRVRNKEWLQKKKTQLNEWLE